ncbi:MAG TPA: NAD(P)/FAD-dependent oxidoreductase [Pyrinomonadaceae bacterium]
MKQSDFDYDVIIAGGGPAGSSAAIHLAQRGLRILLVEQKQFPRPKLCGEFISPECIDHFRNLGVAERMLSCNPTSLTETVFYSHHGHHVSVPSGWFGSGSALGLSRAQMDNNLLRRAESLGVEVLENATVTEVIENDERVCGVRIKTGGDDYEYQAKVTIDATGRGRTLCRKVQQHTDDQKHRKTRPQLVAFKAHFSNTDVARGACEIYSYPGGYGGLSTIENGISNLCFIVAAKDVRRFHSDPETVLRQTVMRNSRAASVLAAATRCSEWLSVSLEQFGMQDPNPKPGLLAIGDSAAFIDPFTGSGMLMALQSGKLAATLIAKFVGNNASVDSASLALLARAYCYEYRESFDLRLRTSWFIRLTAYRPRLAEMTIMVIGLSDRFRNWIARATRSGSADSGSPLQSVK